MNWNHIFQFVYAEYVHCLKMAELVELTEFILMIKISIDFEVPLEDMQSWEAYQRCAFYLSNCKYGPDQHCK